MNSLQIFLLLQYFSFCFADFCKYGKFVGGYLDEDCVCLGGPGIYSITTQNTKLNLETKIVATTTKNNCYYSNKKEKHHFIGSLNSEEAAIGYGIGGERVDLSGDGVVGVVVFGGSKSTPKSTWKLKLKQNSVDTEFCLKPKHNSVCTFQLPSNHVLHSIVEEDCIAMETDCEEIVREDRFCEEKNEKLIGSHGDSRIKREANGTDAASNSTMDPALDEDNSLISQTEIGHELLRTQIARYILSTTAKLVGMTTESRSVDNLQRRYPILKLLELAKVVMQKTCPSITPSFFSMATTAFINLQLESFHLKEPYISYPAFLRIETALKRCINEAKPHVFYFPKNESTTENTGNSTNSTSEVGEEQYCEPPTHLTSNQTLRPDQAIYNTSLPDYATGISANGSDLVINEPLIESVWKLVVNAHSYCYTKFSDYYNDHHSFTVGMLPLFSNDVVDVWLGKDSAGYNLNSGILYGGLLGDVGRLLGDVNNCVGASRVDGVTYPWLLNRPPKEGGGSVTGGSGAGSGGGAAGGAATRRKRDVADEYCLEDGNDLGSVDW